MANRARKPTILDEIMNEAIRLPGCPQIIVTRAWAYQWLKRTGMETDTRTGPFATADYFAFGGSRASVDEPLTDLTNPRVVAFLAAVEADILGVADAA